MKVYLFHSKKSETSYSTRVLIHLMRINGIELIREPNPKPDDVDLWLCSIHDPNPEQIAYMKKARRMADLGTRGQMVIAGGFEAFGGEYALNYCDYLVVGEGFDYFQRLGKCKTIEDVRALAELPYVWVKGRTRIEPSTQVIYEQLPLAKVSKNAYYYLAGRGCKYKCSFCETGFAYPSLHTPGNLVEQALSFVEEQKGRISFVTNDSVELHRVSKATNAMSMRVVDYVRSNVDRQAAFIHFGIEGWNKEQRRWFAKPIEDAVIFELIETLISRKQQAELFFIIGQKDTYQGMMDFTETVPRWGQPYPRIFIKTTRLEPSPHTPLWNYNLDEIEVITPKQRKDWYNVLQSYNKAFRVFTQLSSARSVWRSAIRRSVTFEETEWFIHNYPEAKDTAGEFLEKVDKAGMSHIIRWPDGKPIPGSQVVTPYRELRDKMADKRGVRPITYWSDLGQPIPVPVLAT